MLCTTVVIVQAIEVLGAERIGHGYRVLEDEEVYRLARERGVHFEVSCLCQSVRLSLSPDCLPSTTVLGLSKFQPFYELQAAIRRPCS